MDTKFLRSFSLELASVKTKKQLHKTVNHLLKGILQFRHSTIFLLNKTRTYAHDLFFDPETAILDNPFCEGLAIGKHSAEENRHNSAAPSKKQNVLPYLPKKPGGRSMPCTAVPCRN